MSIDRLSWLALFMVWIALLVNLLHSAGAP